MKLPIVSGKKVIKLLLKKGHWIRNQKGSHVHLRHSTKPSVTVPNHQVVSKGTLKEILRVTRLKAEDLK